MPPPLSSGRTITLEKKSINEEIPDDFFDELADTEFIDDLVEKSRDSGRTAPSPSGASPRDSGSRDGSPQLARCLAEIDELQKKIQRRKRKLERDMVSRDNDSDSDVGRERDRERKGRDRERDRRSRSPLRFHDSYYRRHRSRSNERESERNRGRPYISHRGRKSRSRSRSPNRNYRGSRANRKRSKSPTAKRSGSNHNSLTFLEELAQTFAERGQDFPEKDLIMQPPPHGLMNPMQMAGPPDQFFAAMNPHFPSTSAFPNQINPAYYGINPMSLHPGPYPPASMIPPIINNLHEVQVFIRFLVSI